MIGFLSIPFLLSGCSRIGEKTASMTIVYWVMAILSLMLLVGYCIAVPRKDRWMLTLFAAVFVVNCGYLMLSLSQTLEAALWANRIAYLGSVLLPLCMLMIAVDACGIRKPKWLPVLLLVISVLVFLVAATPGYLNVYYKEVTLGVVKGATVLNKVYGPWHRLYLFYLIAYLVAMVVMLIYAIIRKKVESRLHVIFLAAIQIINIGVWLLEQLVHIEFETLAISYILSEVFLLCLYSLMPEREKQPAVSVEMVQEDIPVPQEIPEPQEDPASAELAQRYESFSDGISLLTRTERIVYDYYVEGKTSREIMQLLDIKENTLKYHNKNIYSKLNVSSRKQMLEIAKLLKKKDN